MTSCLCPSLALALVILVVSGMGYTAESDTPYSWQTPHAKVLFDGDLQWAPEPFKFTAGNSVRYIDYESGNDASNGLGKQTPWKHHPWDSNATGTAKACTGIRTYVFKRGVTYYGKLLADDRGKQSGKPGQPIRLTSDPSWGSGEAMLYGSKPITRGWKKCTVSDASARMPEKNKVWYIDFGKKLVPQTIWEVRAGKISRIPIARSPNWTVANPIDPQKDWWMFTATPTTFDKDDAIHESSKRKTYDPKASKTRWLCDEENLTNSDPDFFLGASVWSEYCFNMGTPHLAGKKVSQFNATRHGIDDVVGGVHPYKVERGNRYFLEDLPQFLDAPGEYYFDKEVSVGSGDNVKTLKAAHPGRLYIRLPGDRDPNESVVELGTQSYIIDVRHQHDVEISGLSFRFNLAPSRMIWPPTAKHPSAVRIVGMCTNITVANCRFEHLVSAVTCWTRGEDAVPLKAYHGLDGPSVQKGPFDDVMENIVICDNDIAHIDDGALMFRDTTLAGTITPPGYISEFKSLRILRNRLFNIGMRQYGPKQSAIPSIAVHDVLQCEIAGNILARCGGSGINLWSAKTGKGSDQRNRPLIRTLVHHNKATNTLLSTNDYGGIEIWQGGPIYVYNNISGNALGRRHYSWFGDDKPKKWNWINWGFAFYTDGQFKSYTFNNIAWGYQGKVSQEWSKGRGAYENSFLNMAPFCDVIGFQNHRFNNTAYKFALGLHLAGNSHSRNSLLGNIFADTGYQYIRGSGSLGGSSATITTSPINLASTSYGHNVYHGVKENCWPALVGRKEWIGKDTVTLQDFKEKLAILKMRTTEAGVMSDEMPLRDPDNHDYRLRRDTVARDAGVKFFVPWGLKATVGEWHFLRHPGDPGIVVGENFYMTDEHLSRDMYNEIPWNNLKTYGVTLASYAAGKLENWTSGALNFNGTNTYCVLADKSLKADYEFTGKILVTTNRSGKQRLQYKGARGLKKGQAPPTSIYPGAQRRTVDIGTTNLLIEVVFKTERGLTNAVLVSKLSRQAGYMLDLDTAGNPRLTLRAAGAACSLSGTTAVNDGKWHHLIAEVDRSVAKEPFGNNLPRFSEPPVVPLGKGGHDAVTYFRTVPKGITNKGMTIYVDGTKIDGLFSGVIPTKTDSLSNTADLLVGKGPSGKLFAGALDFLRICHGTLADAETTIEELYAWQFNGPQFRDFTGRKPVDGRRDAGAIEYRE